MINNPADIKLRAIMNLYPDGTVRWTEGTEYVYEGGSKPQPTEEEIDAEVIRLQAEDATQEYARNRESEYPDIKEQLDYIYHNGLTKWKSDMIKPVKDKYPK